MQIETKAFDAHLWFPIFSKKVKIHRNFVEFVANGTVTGMQIFDQRIETREKLKSNILNLDLDQYFRSPARIEIRRCDENGLPIINVVKARKQKNVSKLFSETIHVARSLEDLLIENKSILMWKSIMYEVDRFYVVIVALTDRRHRIVIHNKIENKYFLISDKIHMKLENRELWKLRR